jgi:CRISPR-associated exonuclease Cas4
MADDPIPVSALEHWSYCPRQCALIHQEQAFAENVHTLRGHAAHARVDEPGFEVRAGVRAERALPIWSDSLGLVGKCDVVEFLPDGTPYPVEFKHGPRRQHAHDDLQLAAQALCLEEMTGKAVPRGAIFHVSSRRRREVEIGSDLRRQVEDCAAAVRAMIVSDRLPPPVNDARCRECSLRDICQPEAVAGRERIATLRAELFMPD